MSVFVDTSAWFAAVNRKDKDHARAAESDLVTSDFVLVETWLLIKNRMDPATAAKFWAGIRTGFVKLEKVSDSDLDLAWHATQRFADQALSLVDASSFIVMERLGLTRAMSFDNDFVIYRFGSNKDRAFEVLR